MPAIDHTPFADRYAEKARLSGQVQKFMSLSRATFAKGIETGDREKLALAIRGFERAKQIADDAETKHGFLLLDYIGVAEIGEARRRAEAALQKVSEPVKIAPVVVPTPKPAPVIARPVAAIQKPAPQPAPVAAFNPWPKVIKEINERNTR